MFLHFLFFFYIFISSMHISLQIEDNLIELYISHYSQSLDFK